MARLYIDMVHDRIPLEDRESIFERLEPMDVFMETGRDKPNIWMKLKNDVVFEENCICLSKGIVWNMRPETPIVQLSAAVLAISL